MLAWSTNMASVNEPCREDFNVQSDRSTAESDDFFFQDDRDENEDEHGVPAGSRLLQWRAPSVIPMPLKITGVLEAFQNSKLALDNQFDKNTTVDNQFDRGSEDTMPPPGLLPAYSQMPDETQKMSATKRATFEKQLRKTKMCSFHMANKCTLGAGCSYAHSATELQAAPSLKKTKLCSQYFRQKCYKPNCDYAHGYKELRATTTVYKTSICRWFLRDLCRAGKNCRFAHGEGELREATEATVEDQHFNGMYAKPEMRSHGNYAPDTGYWNSTRFSAPWVSEDMGYGM